MHANKPQPGLSEKAPGPGLSEHGLRTVLLLAFGGLLALMLVASVSALLSLRQLHAVSQQIASLNGQELAKSNQDLLARFASLQSKLKSMLLAALTAGLVLSLLGTFYVLHLERQERERYLA